MDSESELISLISKLLFLDLVYHLGEYTLDESEFTSLIIRIISVVSSVDLNSQPKPETEFMSLITHAISVFSSMDFDSQPKPLQEVILSISQEISLANSKGSQLSPDFEQLFTLEPEPELISLTYQIFSLVTSMKSKSKLISVCPQVRVKLKNGKFNVSELDKDVGIGKWQCLPLFWWKRKFAGEEETHFYCEGCDGKNHQGYKKAPVEIKHHLHRKHSLQLVMLDGHLIRKCYCCDENLTVFYSCLSCDFAINVGCARKLPVLSIDDPKWHEHTLHLFPRHASSLTCNLCALADASSPLYMCPNCDFVAHRGCINLPLVIRISRHGHRISFTPSFDQGDLFCGICRQEIDNDYGGYSCIKDGCSYMAHSRCATQRNVWDGEELEVEPEEEIEEVEPFVRISDKIIQHFTHQHHHLRLDENRGRDYDENNQCQACITPIYFGNIYSCMQCDFILHEECANLSRRIYNPIHPHLLTLGYEHVVDHKKTCIACQHVCVAGFFYKCGKEECDFKIHVQCATISEPLVHESHVHPLFLTTKPEEEQRFCSVCKERRFLVTNETFNCIECDFALCFRCATLPQMVRYKHDKHVLTLSYGDTTSTMTYWCEVCEENVNPTARFYMCDEYCCVTLHIKCLLGRDLYMKPGSSIFTSTLDKADVLLNNHHMSRPICSFCGNRCPGLNTVL